MSVLVDTKSNRHRKTQKVEPGGTGRKFEHLTRGELQRWEPQQQSAEVIVAKKVGENRKSEGPKNQETDQPNKLWQPERVVTRNSLGATKSTSQTAQEEKEEWNSTGTERGGASPEPGEKRYKKVLNEMIMDQILSRENLNAAYLAVKANDGAPGVDGMSITELKEQVRKHWGTLERKLKAGEYQPAAVRAVEIPKANGGKRTLGIPTVLDRLIQQAIHQVLSPIFEEGFSEHSYGFRAGRSAHDAVRAAQEYVKRGKRWVVDIDLKAFFDQVDHDKLMHLVGQRIRDKAVLKLIGKYLRAPMQRAEKNEARSKGTPQGGPLSPLLANIYLDPLDKELEKRAVSFVRYADDIAIYASSQRSAERIKESVIRWLSKELKLEVNRAKSGAGPTEQSGLLGFRIDQEGRDRRQSNPTAQGTGQRTLGRTTRQNQRRTTPTMETIH
jgi:group II intron reverse transcriptase/maturase